MNMTTLRKPGGALLPLAAALLALVGPLTAAPRFVMEIRDHDGTILIPGESDAPGHPGAIEVVSFGKAYSPNLGFPAIDTTELECGIVSDKALPKLLEALCQGKTFPKVDIYLLGDSSPNYGHMSVEHVQIVELSPVVGEPNPLGFTQNAVAMLSLNFSKVTWTYSKPGEATSSTHLAYENTEDPNFDDDGDGIPNHLDDDDDNDTVPDDYENTNGLNALQDDADGDLDQDKQSNEHEWLAGTRADDGSSFFAISALSVGQTAEGRTATVSFPIIANRHYRLLGTMNPSFPKESWMQFDAFDTAPGSPDTQADVVLNPAVLPQLGKMLFAVEVGPVSP
ncbi:MAG: type VI secretion system tube protein Hcp [Verrucomicrobia bacterium]|nr:type VI secretion system tube protein Hcp [Verrucomicrobiota bacterium]MDA1005568.1 type VI secretion system tube protein Hcp [Verrucomicrobiota bacterium]